MNTRSLILSLLLAAPVVAHQDARPAHPSPAVLLLSQQDPLGLEHVKRLVAELETVAPRNASYVYPIEVQVVADPRVNAGAGYFTTEQDGPKYAILQVFTGMLEAPGLTEAHLRAILAHEMAHLATGHALHKTYEGDTQHALTRQQELEADKLGAGYLVALGRERGEMAASLLWLGRTDDVRSLPWLDSVSGDHASPVMRAALLDPDDVALEAVALFEHGLMYLECGQQRAALPFFDLALEKQPKLHEASLMAARAALQDYYERLPLKVQQAWLQPDFGPMLTEAKLIAGRTTEVTDEDRRRHALALERIGRIPLGVYPWMQMYLDATARVLHPDGDPAVIAAGVDTLRTLYGLEAMQQTFGIEAQAVIRARYANNLALGLQRLGRAGEARTLLLSELAPRQAHVLAVLGNLAHLPLVDLGEEQALLAGDLLTHFLSHTPPGSHAHALAQDSLQALIESAGLALEVEISSPELVYCRAVEARIAGQEVGLFDPASQLKATLGDPDQESRPIEQYPDLGKLVWGEDAEVLAIVERGRVVRLSSKRAGDAVLLTPQGGTARGRFEVRVGMSEAELDALLDPAGDGGVFGQFAILEGPGVFEFWTYYSSLNFGVLLVDGLVQGVTVTPVKG